MAKENVLDLIGLLSLILIPAGFIEAIHPYIRFPFLIIGVVIVGLYLKNYYDNKIIAFINANKIEIKKLKEENKLKMKAMQEKLSKFEGWKEAAESFWLNKKGQINPIVLIILIIIIVIIVVVVQKFT